MGTYYDRHADDCVLCPEGSYSPNEGALVCERCPEGTWTLGTRKENFTSCTGKCSLLKHGKTRSVECDMLAFPSRDSPNEVNIKNWYGLRLLSPRHRFTTNPTE